MSSGLFRLSGNQEAESVHHAGRLGGRVLALIPFVGFSGWRGFGASVVQQPQFSVYL